MTESKDNINTRLKKVRIELGLSSGEFSKGAGIDPRNYSSIETGKRAVGERVLRDICSAFPIKLEWLLTGEGEMLKGNGAESAKTIENPNINELISSQQRTIEDLTSIIKVLTSK